MVLGNFYFWGFYLKVKIIFVIVERGGFIGGVGSFFRNIGKFMNCIGN